MNTAEGSFSITAKTCTLKYNSQEHGSTILDSGNKFLIPIYQRPYSWSDEQIRKFATDIFTSFWGVDGGAEQEPMFIGTMQLSAKDQHGSQDVIDGQQRLTTFLALLKVLKHKYPESVELSKISLNWLSTQVNNGKQQEYLNELINSDLQPNDETLNPYLKNAFLLAEIIEEEVKDEEGSNIEFDINKFVQHLLSNVYFVVIETRAGLSKTLQIFNAINTTGLDLNGGDIFKIKMYEYLRDKKGKGEEAFNEISNLYEKIDTYNQQLGEKVAGIHGILEIYQMILIARHNLPTTLYTYGADTFFEKLFDTIFNINQWEHFKNNAHALELSLEDLNRIIEVRYGWERRDYPTAEDESAMCFIWDSRYGRYWKLIFVYLYSFEHEENVWNNMFRFVRQLSKLYIIYSVRFQKAVNDVHRFTYQLTSAIISKSSNEVIDMINSKIGRLDNHKGWGDFENTIKGDITYNAKLKNILCKLSALLDEDYITTDAEKKKSIVKNIFYSPIDIEHIQAYHDIKPDERERIWKEWGNEINSLGNLVVLEQRLNRKIRNESYSKKRLSYAESKINAVNNIRIEHLENWDLQSCRNRKQREYDKIVSYIFPESHDDLVKELKPSLGLDAVLG